MRVPSRSTGVLLTALLWASARGQEAPDVAPEDVAAARAKAVELTGLRDYPGAIAVLRDAAKRLGPSAALTTQEGVVYLIRGEDEGANGADAMLVRALHVDAAIRARKALELDPDFTDAVMLLANALRADGDDDGAKTALVGWLEKHPKDAAVHLALANAAYAAKQWSNADLHYTRYLEIVPLPAGAPAFVETQPGPATARLNQTIARQWLRVAVDQLEPGYLDAARLLPEADAPLKLLAGLHPRDRERKLAAFGKVLETNPKAVKARLWIAYVLRKDAPRDTKKALAVLEEARKLAPDDPAVHMNLGDLLREEGGAAEAAREYLVVVEKSAPGAAATASVALDRLLNTELAPDALPMEIRERAYDALVAKNPSEGSYGNNAGLWFRDVGRDYEKSLKYYLASVKAAPDDQDFLNDTALIYLFHLADRKEACLPMFEKVRRLVEKDRQPPIRGYWDTLENLCKYWFEKGEFQKVLECAEKRADPTAAVNGRPYPSLRAVQWKLQAEAELARAR
jgi:tetratricopeptide (TPR) repeat protein